MWVYIDSFSSTLVQEDTNNGSLPRQVLKCILHLTINKTPLEAALYFETRGHRRRQPIDVVLYTRQLDASHLHGEMYSDLGRFILITPFTNPPPFSLPGGFCLRSTTCDPVPPPPSSVSDPLVLIMKRFDPSCSHTKLTRKYQPRPLNKRHKLINSAVTPRPRDFWRGAPPTQHAIYMSCDWHVYICAVKRSPFVTVLSEVKDGAQRSVYI